MEAGAEALTAFAQDLPLRHRSLRASFEHSWNLLSPHEQEILRRLAVFQGGFTREAAKKVAGADLATLARLADKSLLRRTVADRYDLYAVLRPYVTEILRQTPTEHQDTRARHARYYLADFMAQRETELREGRQGEAMTRFREEFGNVQAAWRRAAADGLTAEISRGLLPAMLLIEMHGWWREGEITFAAAAEKLKARLPPLEELNLHEKIALGAVLAMHGIFCVRTSDLATAKLRLEESQALLSALPVVAKETAYGHFGLGLLASKEGDHAAAQDHYHTALAQARAADDPLLIAYLLDHLNK